MSKILIGLIFLFVNLNLLRINLLPSFVGYILLFLGLDEEYECPSLNATRTICVGSAIIGAVLWVAGLFGYGMTFPIATILQLLVTYRLTVWAEEQGEEQGWTAVQTRKFRLNWYILAGTMLAATVLSWVNPIMALVWALAAAVAAVCYICTYYKLWRSAVPAEDGEEG